MLRLNSRLAPGAIKSFQSFVCEAPDHARIVTY
jgi:hypothetical protein